MPCVKAARGTRTGQAAIPPFVGNTAQPPFNDVTDNNPCGKFIVSVANGVDVSAHSMCLPHLQAKLGLKDVQPPYTLSAVVTAPPAPTLTQLIPDSSGSWTTQVQVMGTNFTPATQVYANGIPVNNTVYVSATEIDAIVSSASTTGVYQITAREGGQTSNALPYTRY